MQWIWMIFVWNIFYKITIHWQVCCDGVVYGLYVSMTKLSWAHFAALLSFGIIFLSRKFACIAMVKKKPNLLSLPTWPLFGAQNCISWHWEVDILFKCSWNNGFDSKIFWQSPMSTSGFSVSLIDWIHALVWAFRGLYSRAYSSYL